jgi:phycocyanin-associated rod protein
MLTASAIGGSSTPSASRVFVYEVSGLRQNPESDKNDYPIRKSGSTFIKVPYPRMNDEMRRIARMGGQIVSIRPLDAAPAAESDE